MALTPAQEVQINGELEVILVRNTYMANCLSITEKRIRRLKEANFHLETIFVNAQVLEHFLRLSIDAFGSKRYILKLLNEKDISEHVDLRMEEETTLGGLIKILSKLKASDPTLIRRLYEFNALRKEAVHHIFDGTRETDAFEKRIEDYFKGSDFSGMVRGVFTVQKVVIAEIKKIVTEYQGQSKKHTKRNPTKKSIRN